ncbi:multiheme c-type cytochrome [Vibrio mediterranei]|uniref:Deca-heme c-type cytochrome n=1 Tax=Vibrio mediterranei TaxID=689 RepID=A0ABX5DKS1_9VIBR|nr:multiheme c-type cytochrome [Vibrio mediterranei]PCD88212.1 deca-heme c-type cytochrome [Vibrio mediterranei]PRQ68886.1 deca-heme c-type cytochrome [Vibrio mediterranei]
MGVMVRVLLALVSVGFTSSSVSSELEGASFVGSDACIECHAKEVESWIGSDHERAMDHATSESVLADFNNVQFKYQGNTNRFYKKDDEFWVNIQGPDGDFHDYQILYTFGHYPLQQYMVQFDDGRVQLIPFTWDSRDKESGGQRWYHLYPDTTPNDEFYWTNSGQNWNFMCADCHSTNLHKGYDKATNQYETTWSEINVGCEACHGPASVHIELAKQGSDGSFRTVDHYGFNRDLSQAVTSWVFKQGKSTLQPSDIKSTQQVKVCAQCHSRRVQLTEDYDHVQGEILDRYLVSNLTQELYHADGQIYDEVYVLGSFEQSKMAQMGVTCTNCHDPHTAKLKIPEESVCLQCHIASEYSSENHTFHQKGSEADKCTTCHMPETTYMEVDPRRDHSWHVPRPDLTQHIKTPNVCTTCHESESPEWASKTLAVWFPESEYQNSQHYGIAFYASAIGHRAAADALSYIGQDNSEASIVRASALQRLANYPGQNSLIALGRAVKNSDAMVRVGAIQGSEPYPSHQRWQIISPLLTDPVLAVRTEAAGALARYWQELNPLQKDQLKPALKEYIAVQEFNSDRGFGRTNLGNVYAAQGKTKLAIAEYEGAILVEPYFANSYINLADLYRAQGQEALTEQTLQIGIKNQPNSAAIRYSAALSKLRQGEKLAASDLLKQAVDLEKDNAQYWYVYGLSMESINLEKAISALNQAFKISRNPEQLYAQCDMLLKYQKPEAKACLQQLSQFAPKEVIEQLQSRY